MRASMAYFAGAGTIVVALAAGLGGGLTIANVVSPHKETREVSKLEQRMSTKPIQASSEADQSRSQVDKAQTEQPKTAADQPKAPVPYLAATQGASTPIVVAPAPQSQPQTEAAASEPQPAATSQQPVEARVANDQPAKVANDQPAWVANDQPAKPAEPQARPQAAPREQVASTEDADANARARDVDLKRLAAEKRKAERRQQWAERQKAQQQREAQLRDVEASVRRDTDGPRIVMDQDDDGPPRGDFRRPVRSGFPVINLFGADRD